MQRSNALSGHLEGCAYRLDCFGKTWRAQGFRSRQDYQAHAEEMFA